MTDNPITAEHVRAVARLRQMIHFDGQGFFGDIHQCIQFPRLSRVTKYIKKTRSTEVSWQVDGAPVESFDAAIAALNVPAVLTEAETAALAKYPTEWTDAHDVMRLLSGGTVAEGYELHHALCNKGFTENDGQRRWRRRP